MVWTVWRVCFIRYITDILLRIIVYRGSHKYSNVNFYGIGYGDDISECIHHS
jgi:hypothetical protein